MVAFRGHPLHQRCYALHGVQSGGVAYHAGIGAGLPEQYGNLLLLFGYMPQSGPSVRHVDGGLDPVRDGHVAFQLRLLGRICDGDGYYVPVYLGECDVVQDGMLVQSNLVNLEIRIVPSNGQGVQHRYVQDVPEIVVRIADLHAHVLAAVVHHGELGVDEGRVRKTLPVLGEVLLHGLLGGPFLVGLVRYGLVEHWKGVHPPAFDLVHQRVYGIQIVIDPKAAGEEYAYRHPIRIQGGKVLFLGDVPVHAGMIVSVASLHLGLGWFNIGEPHDVRYVMQHGVIVLGAPAGRIFGKRRVLFVGTLEEGSVEQGDLGIAAVYEHISLRFLQDGLQFREPLEAVGVGHAAHEEEISLLRLPYQFLILQDIVVRIVAVQSIYDRFYSKIDQSLRGFGHVSGIG